MILGDLRTELQSVSGRRDLTNDRLTEYLNRGQRLLDELSEFSHSPGEIVTQLTRGDFVIRFTSRPKVVQSVTLFGADNAQIELQFLRLKELKLYNPLLIGSRDQGCPIYFSLGNVRHIPDNSPNALAPLVGIIEDGDVTDSTAVVLDCPIDQGYIAEITGKFYSPTLYDGEVMAPSEKVETTWWTRYYPDLVILAARYKIDVDTNNSEGVSEKLKLIQFELNGIFNNFVEQEVEHISVMRG